jgi:hypothetical protein
MYTQRVHKSVQSERSHSSATASATGPATWIAGNGWIMRVVPIGVQSVTASVSADGGHASSSSSSSHVSLSSER